MRLERTQRGFGIIRFKDEYNVNCSLQKSSIATKQCIWLGCDEANPRVCIRGKGWQKIDLPQDTACDTRMHLTRKQVFNLLPILIKFVLVGRL